MKKYHSDKKKIPKKSQNKEVIACDSKATNKKKVFSTSY
jgi:hypothetical protein